MIDKSSEYLKTKDTIDTTDFTSCPESCSSYYGNYLVFFKYRTSDYLITIGPHWYVSLIGFSLIGLVGGLIIVPLWSLIGIKLKVLYLIVYGFSLGMYLVMFFKNPGIIPQKRNANLEMDVEAKRNYSCLKCLSLKNQNAYHCEDCDVCIEEYDHHCVWVGKCVGKGNLIAFYVFVASIPGFFIFIMFMSCFISLNIKPNS